MPLQFDIGNNYCPIWLFFIYLTLCLICAKNYIFKLRNLMVLQKLDLLPRQILANNCVSLRLYLINGRFVLICWVSLRGKWFLLGLMFLNSRSFFFLGGGGHFVRSVLERLTTNWYNYVKSKCVALRVWYALFKLI